MPENLKRDRPRAAFWRGLIIGIFVGAMALYLFGMAMWNGPF